MSVAAPTPTARERALRHRRSARRLTAGQLEDLREAFAKAQRIKDDRGYQAQAGIHGLPLPESCRHHSQLFLPWHRAYLYFFEKALQERVPGVTVPWWDWTVDHGIGIPRAYRKAPLLSSPIQPAGRRFPNEGRTWRQAGLPSWLPTREQVRSVLANRSFSIFQTQLEGIHNGIHGWVGGTMNSPEVAAYDPIFWAQIVTVTERVRELVVEGKAAAKVTVFAHAPDGAALEVLDFARLRLLTYAG